MKTEARLETRAESVEFFCRGEHVAAYNHAGAVPGIVFLNGPDRRSVLQPAATSGAGAWIGFASLDGWAFGEPRSQVAGRHESVALVARRGSQSVGIQHSCVCSTPDSRLLLTEVRTLRVRPGPSGGTIVDLQVDLGASEGSRAILQRTDRGMLRLQLAQAFIGGGGTLRNSAGSYGSDLNGQAASWCGAVGVIRAETVGLVVFDHPDNPFHPPVWTLDPSGQLEINSHAYHTMVIEPGRSVTYRFRLLTHAGYVDQGWADVRLQELVNDTL